MEIELSSEELNERVAVLRRFRTLLEKQREKFREYLNVLEKQHGSIQNDNPEAILVHAELEQQVVASISNLQKVIEPMHRMYTQSAHGTDKAADVSIEKLQGELTSLQSKVLEQNQINRALLREHLAVLRAQMDAFKNPYRNNRSVYATSVAQGSLVAVEV